MGTHLPLPIFGPCLLWPNGWLDQDATWYGGRPQPRRHCIRWGSCSPSQKGTRAPNFRLMSIVYWRQTAVMIKMSLGLEVGLSPGHFVLDGTPKNGGGPEPPQFSAHVCCGQMAGWTKMPLGTKVDLSLGHIVLHGDPVAPPPKKRAQLPPISVHVYCGQMVAYLSYC